MKSLDRVGAVGKRERGGILSRARRQSGGPFLGEIRHARARQGRVRLEQPETNLRPPAPAVPACRHAARSVLTSRHTIVIGPTPPGTGVMAPATSTASAKHTSPTILRFAVRARHPVDADVDHGCARLDPAAAHEFGAADGDEQQFGAPAQIRQVARLRMRDGHGRIGGEQKLAERIADNIGTADDERIEAGE